MKLKYYLRLACPSFDIKNLRQYFTIIFIIRGFFSALLLSLFIYLDYFEMENPLLNTILAVSGFYFLLKENQIVLFWIGFFIGVFWFYWIGFSFRYYGMPYLIPFMIIFTAFVYGFLFWFIGAFKEPFIRALLILTASFVHPLGFNWFIPEAILTNGFIGVSKWQFAIFLFSIALFIKIKNRYRIISFLILLLAADWQTKEVREPNLKIKLSSPSLAQNIKWDPKYLPSIVRKNISQIEEAIREKYDIIILSESIFPLYLDRDKNLMNLLKKLSKKITIVTGALSYKNDKVYNSTYYFVNGKVTIADKVFLVPFGEEVPLPKFMAKYVNKIFFDGASDYSTAKKPTDIKIKGYTFRNAICYEATKEEMYENAPPYIIATSNNAWFTPSIEPVLQKIILKYLAKKYGKIIYHSANMGITAVIKG